MTSLEIPRTAPFPPCGEKLRYHGNFFAWDRLAPLDSAPGLVANLVLYAFAVYAMVSLEILRTAPFRLTAKTALSWEFLRFRDRLAPLDSAPGLVANLVLYAFAVYAMVSLEILRTSPFRLTAKTSLSWEFLRFRDRLAPLDSAPGLVANLVLYVFAVYAMVSLAILRTAPFPPCGENCAIMGISSLPGPTRSAGLGPGVGCELGALCFCRICDGQFRISQDRSVSALRRTALSWEFLRFRDRLAPLDSVPGLAANLVPCAFAVYAMASLEIPRTAPFPPRGENCAVMGISSLPGPAPLDSGPGLAANLVPCAFAVYAMASLEIPRTAPFPPYGENCAIMGISSPPGPTRSAGLGPGVGCELGTSCLCHRCDGQFRNSHGRSVSALSFFFCTDLFPHKFAPPILDSFLFHCLL